MNTYTTTDSEETPRYPEPVGDGDDPGESRQAGPDTEDRDPEEAGYGYGV